MSRLARNHNINTPGQVAVLRNVLREAGAEVLPGFRFTTQGQARAERKKKSEPCDMESYVKRVYGLQAAAHHQTWIEAIVDCIEGRAEKQHLLIVAPPGTAKSTYVSLGFPCWYLSQHPDKNILALTSSDTQAHKFLLTVKATLENSESHAQICPQSACRPDKNRGWSGTGLYLNGTPEFSKDPAYLCAGWGSSIIGNRADAILIDDPLTQDQARSRVEQQKAKDYYDATVFTRLRPDGHIIAVMTRWHELDMAAHFVAQGNFRVIIMPALTQIGEDEDNNPVWESIWPELFTVEFYLGVWAQMGSSWFGCVYQGDPTAMGGGFFKSAKWFKELPPDFDPMKLPRIQYWDLIYGRGNDAGDWMVGLTLAVKGLDLFVVDVARTQCGEDERLGFIVERVNMWKPIILRFEVDNFHLAVVQDLVRAVAAESGRIPQMDRPEGTKQQRAMMPAARAESGHLYVDTSAPWYPVFESECLAFDNAAHDDQVDALSGAAAATGNLRVVKDTHGTPYTFHSSQRRAPRYPGFSRVGR